MDYPDVPDVPGVPAVLRVPPAAFSLVGQGLASTSSIMRSLSAAALSHPTRAISTIAASVQDATTIMGGVSGAIGNYVNSSLGDFAAPVDRINDGLASITTSIVNTPSAPLSSIADTIDSTAVEADATSTDFDESQQPESLDGVESVTVSATRGGPQWGIFKGGTAVIKAESVGEFGIKKEWTISDYPVEEGGFQSYNKVYIPFDARIQFRAGGSVENREALLKSVEDIAGDLQLYDVQMPEKVYQSVNVVHYDLRRKFDNGLGILIIDVYLEEVRDTADAEFSTPAPDPSSSAPPSAGGKNPAPKPKSPTAAPKKSNGTVQAKQVRDQATIDSANAMMQSLM